MLLTGSTLARCQTAPPGPAISAGSAPGCSFRTPSCLRQQLVPVPSRSMHEHSSSRRILFPAPPTARRSAAAAKLVPGVVGQRASSRCHVQWCRGCVKRLTQVGVTCTGRSSQRRDAVQWCFAPDAAFEHPFFVICGRGAIFWIYEGWSLLNRRKVTFDATLSGALQPVLYAEGCTLQMNFSAH